MKKFEESWMGMMLIGRGVNFNDYWRCEMRLLCLRYNKSCYVKLWIWKKIIDSVE